MSDAAEWGRADIDAEAKGQVIHLTQYGHDGPGRRRRTIDDLHPRYIDAKGHAAGERYLTELAKLPDMISNPVYEAGSAPSFGPKDWKCQSDDARSVALAAVTGAHRAIERECGVRGLALFANVLSGQRIAYIAQQRGFMLKGGVYGNAASMASEVRAVFDALATHFEPPARCEKTGS